MSGSTGFSARKEGEMDKNVLYRSIPKVDILLEKDEIKTVISEYGHEIVMDIIREETDRLRLLIAEAETETGLKSKIDNLTETIVNEVKNLFKPKVRKVINGTGTILHTNLGRAPITRTQAELLKDIVCGYSNLEYNLESGKRGERYSHFEKLLCRITGAEAAMVVNNNAAAVMLILSTMAKGGEVVVSRGELIEIGGKFRIPDVMEQSGAKLVEIGTTNKTHLSDYEEAVTENTKAFLKVHTSNYSIVGFTQSVTASELKPLAEDKGLPIIEDLGSGVLIDLAKFGLTHEPTVQEAIEAGVDVVCFSGDKLLGGPQAGIIIGKKKYINMMKKNQLTRALRVDKFTVTALELVLLSYLNEEKAISEIPVLKMISETYDSVKERAGRLADILRDKCKNAEITIEDCESQVGGGSLPLERIKSVSVVIKPKNISVTSLEEIMHHSRPAIVARTAEDAIWMDVRTLLDEDFETIGSLFGGVL